MPFFSIIIPTCNSAETLSIALDSIMQQNFTNFEVIVVDGSSKDDTLDIITRYTDSRIKVWSEPDKGVYDAMNKGIKKASGEWLYFLGSDDYLYDNNVLGDVATFLKHNEYNVVYGKVQSERFGGDYGEMFDADKLLYENICHQAIFFHKNIYAFTGLFNLQYKAQADWDHNMCWFFSGGVRHSYLNRHIAVYSDGGLSAAGDALFEQHRIINYVRHAGNKLPVKRRLQLLKYAWHRARKQNKSGLLPYILKTGFTTLLQW